MQTCHRAREDITCYPTSLTYPDSPDKSVIHQWWLPLVCHKVGESKSNVQIRQEMVAM